MTATTPDAGGDGWELHPVDAARWPDLVQLFGTAGGREGCWCMRWRLPRELFERERGDPNRLRLQRGIADGRVHGILAYTEGRPVGWCAFGPRQQFPVLASSDALAALDDVPVWSVSCFYVSPQARRRGLNAALLQAAGQHARSLGATVLEGYPLDPAQPRLPVAACWTGLLSSFLAAGFVEVARRAPQRPLVRLDLARVDASAAGVG